MCATYRLALEKDEDEIISRLSSKYSQSVAEKYAEIDLYPKNDAPVVGRGNKIALLRWGFPMAGRSGVVFNARAEGLLKKPFYKDCLNNRCAVPFTAFYEWGAADGEKSKFIIKPKAGGLLYMAAIYRPFTSCDGARGFCFVIITTKPSAQIAVIHSRMPVVIGREGLDAWIEGENPIEAMQAPYEGEFEIRQA